MSYQKAYIHDSAMSWDMQQDCVDCAAHALATLSKKDLRTPTVPPRPVHGGTTVDHTVDLPEQNTVAEFIQKELEEKYGPRWHVVVGHSFGSLVGHESSFCIYFSIEDIFFLIWKMDKNYESIEVKTHELLALQQQKRDAKRKYY